MNSSKKRTNEFDFTTMIPQFDLFLFVFWKKLKTPKGHFEINWPLAYSFLGFNLSFFYKYLVKMQMHKNKNSSSESISPHCVQWLHKYGALIGRHFTGFTQISKWKQIDKLFLCNFIFRVSSSFEQGPLNIWTEHSNCQIHSRGDSKTLIALLIPNIFLIFFY